MCGYHPRHHAPAETGLNRVGDQNIYRPDLFPVRSIQHTVIDQNLHRQNSRRWWQWAILAAFVLLVVFIPLSAGATVPTERSFRIEASRFEYSPAILEVNPGDKVTIELVATDVVHGLSIDGYNLETTADPGKTTRHNFYCRSAGFIPLSLYHHLWQFTSLHDWQAGGGTEHFIVAGNWTGGTGIVCWCLEGAKMTRLQEIFVGR